MNNNDLVFRNVIVIAITFILFVSLLVVGLSMSSDRNAKKFELCVTNGGTWDSRTFNCYMPGADIRE